MCVCVLYIYSNFLDYVSFCEVVSLYLKKFPCMCVCVCVCVCKLRVARQYS